MEVVNQQVMDTKSIKDHKKAIIIINMSSSIKKELMKMIIKKVKAIVKGIGRN